MLFDDTGGVRSSVKFLCCLHFLFIMGYLLFPLVYKGIPGVSGQPWQISEAFNFPFFSRLLQSLSLWTAFQDVALTVLLSLPQLETSGSVPTQPVRNMLLWCGILESALILTRVLGQNLRLWGVPTEQAWPPSHNADPRGRAEVKQKSSFHQPGRAEKCRDVQDLSFRS